jgi:hypothetical protein
VCDACETAAKQRKSTAKQPQISAKQPQNRALIGHTIAQPQPSTTHHIGNHKQRTTNHPTTVATTSSTAIHNSIHSTTTFNHKHNFHNRQSANRQSANKQNFLSTTLENLECLIEHTTNAEESLYLEGEGGRSKSKTLRMNGSSFLDHWS